MRFKISVYFALHGIRDDLKHFFAELHLYKLVLWETDESFKVLVLTCLRWSKSAAALPISHSKNKEYNV